LGGRTTAQSGLQSNAAHPESRGGEPLLDGVFRAAGVSGSKAARAGIPISVVRNFEDVVEHPQSAARQIFPLDHPTAGSHRVTGTPIKLPRHRKPGQAAPMLGQHSASALRDLLGLDDAALGALAGRGVI
jgi:crotonobetainyl-CoA:carnitine CoA-transferase CaiB-like acyl-CoA transferase